MPRRDPCSTCDDVGLIVSYDANDTRKLVLCPDCRVVNMGERYSKKEGFRCVRLSVEGMTNMSWCGREIGRELAFLDVNHALTEILKRTGHSACPQCALAIRAALRMRA